MIIKASSTSILKLRRVIFWKFEKGWEKTLDFKTNWEIIFDDENR